jgi:hypothetical protein
LSTWNIKSSSQTFSKHLSNVSTNTYGKRQKEKNVFENCVNTFKFIICKQAIFNGTTTFLDHVFLLKAKTVINAQRINKDYYFSVNYFLILKFIKTNFSENY